MNLKLVKAHNPVRYSENNQIYTENNGANNDNGTLFFHKSEWDRTESFQKWAQHKETFLLY